MAKEQTNSTTTNSTPGSCFDCQVSLTRRVSYLFKTGLWEKPLASEKSLSIPYALAIDGRAHPDFAKRAGVLKAYQVKNDIFVEPGRTVALFLNSDAAPANRKNPVFAVTPKERDIEVVVSEKRGKLGADDTPKFKETKEIADKTGAKRKVDVYEATLTGDIWMKVSHRYTADEAKALIPASTAKEVRDAVLKIYDGSLKGELSLTTPGDDGQPKTIAMSFESAENAVSNTMHFEMYQDGLPRVHPQAWVAVIEAALKTGVKHVTTNSGWRPMLGAIVHRTGLGLDVGYLDKTHLNREELRGKGRHAGNVSDEEKRLFKEKEQAEAEVAAAEEHRKALVSEKSKLDDLKKTAPGKVDPLRAEALDKELKEAVSRLKQANAQANDVTSAWNTERDKNEPGAVKSFRSHLSRCKCVSQVFDPWFLDRNTRDDVPGVPNQQKDGNEALHATHLHVTVFDPSLPTS